jgi:hypothetical protein
MDNGSTPCVKADVSEGVTVTTPSEWCALRAAHSGGIGRDTVPACV